MPPGDGLINVFEHLGSGYYVLKSVLYVWGMLICSNITASIATCKKTEGLITVSGSDLCLFQHQRPFTGMQITWLVFMVAFLAWDWMRTAGNEGPHVDAIV